MAIFVNGAVGSDDSNILLTYNQSSYEDCQDVANSDSQTPVSIFYNGVYYNVLSKPSVTNNISPGGTGTVVKFFAVSDIPQHIDSEIMIDTSSYDFLYESDSDGECIPPLTITVDSEEITEDTVVPYGSTIEFDSNDSDGNLSTYFGDYYESLAVSFSTDEYIEPPAELDGAEYSPSEIDSIHFEIDSVDRVVISYSTYPGSEKDILQLDIALSTSVYMPPTNDVACVHEFTIDNEDNWSHTVSNLQKSLENVTKVYYGTCTTSGGTSAKVVTCPGFVLEEGATINVYFNWGNLSANPTLNVNNTGAKDIKRNGSFPVSSTYWSNQQVVSFTFIGDTSTGYWSAIGVSTYVSAGQKSGTTIGNRATAEGWSNEASGSESHAEGENTTASGSRSHAEGYYTVAWGNYSHAEGSGTEAHARSQHVFGEYNIVDTSDNRGERGTYVEIVGKGSSPSNLSNARTLDWDGNEVLAGKLTVGSAPTNNMDVATKQYVDDNSKTFLATYGTTSFDDIKNAYDSGNLVALLRLNSGSQYNETSILTTIDTGTNIAYFRSIGYHGDAYPRYIRNFTCTKGESSDTWAATGTAAMPRIESGTYAGTGVYGSSNPITFSCYAQPAIIFIKARASSQFFVIPVLGSSSTNGALDGTARAYAYLSPYSTSSSYLSCLSSSYGSISGTSANGYTVSIYSSANATLQANVSGTTYYYSIIYAS